MSVLSDKLLSRLPQERKFPVGITASDTKNLNLTDELKSDILAALISDDLNDVRFALFFATTIPTVNVDRNFQSRLIEAVLKAQDVNDSQIKSDCTEIIAKYGKQLANYRVLMLAWLKDTDSEVRRVALRYYGVYANKGEFKPLESYEKDDSLTEVGMGSHLIYDLRNLALETIEKITGNVFEKTERSEALNNGQMAFWWDWKPFHDWKNRWWRKLL